MSGKDLNEKRKRVELGLYLVDKHLRLVNTILSSPLPKSGYSKRRNGVKVKQRNNQESKWKKFFKIQMRLTLERNALIEEYEQLLKNFTMKKGKSIKDVISESSNSPQAAEG